jgi:hypothetical protein
VSRFLAVESCGQCTPCKLDGLTISDILDRVRQSQASEEELMKLDRRLLTVADSARCNLATQHQIVVGSLLKQFPDALARHALGHPASDPYLIAAIVDIDGTRAVLDTKHAQKQPDWTYDEEWSGKTPADVIDERAHHQK